MAKSPCLGGGGLRQLTYVFSVAALELAEGNLVFQTERGGGQGLLLIIFVTYLVNVLTSNVLRIIPGIFR